MQKLTAIAAVEDKKKLIAELMELGVAEITEQREREADEAFAGFLKRDEAAETAEGFEKKLSEARAALAVLEKYAAYPKPLFVTQRRISRQRADAAAGSETEAAIHSRISELLSLEAKISEASDKINRAESDIAMLQPWTAYDLPLSLKNTETVNLITGILPKSELHDIAALREIITDKLREFALSGAGNNSCEKDCEQTPADYVLLKEVSADKEYMYIAALIAKRETEAAMTELRRVGFSELDLCAFHKTADEAIKELHGAKSEAEEELCRLKAEICTYAGEREAIEEYADYFAIERDKERICEKLLRTEKTFVLEAWMPVRAEKAVAECMESVGAYYSFRPPQDGEEVPVLLENRGFFRPTEAITEMYSLPGYGGFDPTAIYSFFYIIFFGMMFSDAGYGLILAIGCILILKKFELAGTTEKMLRLFFYCGISTTVWGLLFGGFFGDAIAVFSNNFIGSLHSFDALWFNPLEDPMKLLIFSLILGVIHLFIGMGIQAYMHIKEGKLADAFFEVGVWYVALIGLALWLCASAVFESESMAAAGMWLSLLGALGLAFAGARGKKGIARITGAFSNIYSITSWISDILSYARLLALGLATGVIAQVVNTMGSLFGGGAAGVLLFVLIFIVGHAVNFAINLLGAFIHSARLQYVEFFGKFYIDGGEPFDPFRRRMTYVRVEKD